MRRRDPSCLEAAWFLVTPPFALAAASLVVGLVLAALSGAWPLVTILCGGLVALSGTLVTGLLQARAGLRTWLALLSAPWYIAWKSVVQIRALISVARRATFYGPTTRRVPDDV